MCWVNALSKQTPSPPTPADQDMLTCVGSMPSPSNVLPLQLIRTCYHVSWVNALSKQCPPTPADQDILPCVMGQCPIQAMPYPSNALPLQLIRTCYHVWGQCPLQCQSDSSYLFQTYNDILLSLRAVPSVLPAPNLS